MNSSSDTDPTGEAISHPNGSISQTLRLTEKRFRLLVDAVGDYATFLLDPTGIVTSWNKGAQRISGYSHEEIIGQHFSCFYPPEGVEKNQPAHELNAARQHGRFEDEGWRLRKDGSRYRTKIVITALFDERGELWGYSKITRDLSERRAFEDALRKSEERFRLLAEGVRDCAIFLLSPEGIVSSWNSGAEHVKGYKTDEIVGHHFSRFYPPDDVEKKWPQQYLKLAEEQGSYEDEGWRIRKDGSRFWAHIMITALHDQDGYLYGFAKVTRDLTERRRVQSLELAEQRMKEFLALLSHELRNPLAPIRGALDVMRMATPEDPAHERARQIIDRQVSQISRLVDDLLDISRVTAGTIKLVNQTVDLREAVARAVETSMPLIKSRRHNLEQNLPTKPVMITGDQARLVQVLTNLLNNAALYTPNRGRIQLSLEVVNGRARIRVTDNGEGIPPDSLESIFNLFTQGERPSDRAQTGLGIGLSLARQLVEMQAGTLSAHSDGRGQGSEFTIELPIATSPVPGSESKKSPGPAKKTAGKRLRILVVEDLPDVAESMTMVLQFWGHEVTVVPGGIEAIEAAPGFAPDVVLLDIGLPGMSGYEVARNLRQLPGFDEVTLIALTGYGQPSDREQALASGFDYHLVKGGSLDELRELLTPVE